MPLFRFLLLLLLAGMAVLFAIENAAVTLAITFLGGQSIVLPLWGWVLGAMVAGSGTTILLTGLLRLAEQLGPKRYPANRRSVERRPRDRPSGFRFPSSWSNPFSGWTQAIPRSTSSARDHWQGVDASDWFEEPNDQPRDRDEWAAPRSHPRRRDDIYAPPDEPARTPKPSRRDEVVDADFRVIIPPHRHLDETDR